MFISDIFLNSEKLITKSPVNGEVRRKADHDAETRNLEPSIHRKSRNPKPTSNRPRHCEAGKNRGRRHRNARSNTDISQGEINIGNTTIPKPPSQNPRTSRMPKLQHRNPERRNRKRRDCSGLRPQTPSYRGVLPRLATILVQKRSWEEYNRKSSFSVKKSGEKQ